ncbi:hypothetical protein HMPREF0578_0555 [Mobiluncus mulieris 28-1]|nr:hypothetical protein HMPREF0578_0555 [Mobiluncus mulieris 28-1]
MSEIYAACYSGGSGLGSLICGFTWTFRCSGLMRVRGIVEGLAVNLEGLGTPSLAWLRPQDF